MIGRHPGVRGNRPGFTLVELMVVVSITGVLVGVMMPAVARAWDVARLARCASNLHQISVAMSGYVGQYGKYPPNALTSNNVTLKYETKAGNYWYDDDRLGRFMPALRPPVPPLCPGGGPYVCPTDDPGTVFLSYAMNYWAGSLGDAYAGTVTAAQQDGTRWTPRVPEPARMILFAEAYTAAGSNNQWYAKPTIGLSTSTGTATTAGQRFGGGGGIAFSAGRWLKVTSELCYMRHRFSGEPGRGTQSRGRVNILYADGHVASKTDRDLVRPDGTTTGDSCWSPADLPGI